MKYIDTSALVKYYGNPEYEKGVNEVISLIEKVKRGEVILVTSIFTIGEAISVFDRWIRIRAIDEEEFKKIIARFVIDTEELNNSGGLIIENLSSLSVAFSIEHILKHHITINDSLHLYTAISLKPQIDEFISSDERQLNAAKKEGFEIWNPETENK